MNANMTYTDTCPEKPPRLHTTSQGNVTLHQILISPLLNVHMKSHVGYALN
jgi:hypothetical protein